MRFQSALLTTTLFLTLPLTAFAQPLAAGGLPSAPGVVIEGQPNTTGNDRDEIIALGATGADTITTDSAAGGNASHPERASPNGSAGGSDGGGADREGAKRSLFIFGSALWEEMVLFARTAEPFVPMKQTGICYRHSVGAALSQYAVASRG